MDVQGPGFVIHPVRPLYCDGPRLPGRGLFLRPIREPGHHAALIWSLRSSALRLEHRTTRRAHCLNHLEQLIAFAGEGCQRKELDAL